MHIFPDFQTWLLRKIEGLEFINEDISNLYKDFKITRDVVSVDPKTGNFLPGSLTKVARNSSNSAMIRYLFSKLPDRNIHINEFLNNPKHQEDKITKPLEQILKTEEGELFVGLGLFILNGFIYNYVNTSNIHAGAPLGNVEDITFPTDFNGIDVEQVKREITVLNRIDMFISYLKDARGRADSFPILNFYHSALQNQKAKLKEEYEQSAAAIKAQDPSKFVAPFSFSKDSISIIEKTIVTTNAINGEKSVEWLPKGGLFRIFNDFFQNDKKVAQDLSSLGRVLISQWSEFNKYLDKVLKGDVQISDTNYLIRTDVELKSVSKNGAEIFIILDENFNTIPLKEPIIVTKAGYISEEEQIPEYNKILNELGAHYYWILIDASTSDDESKNMYHCGNAGAPFRILSFRNKYNKSFLTASFDKDAKVYRELKAASNQKPPEKWSKAVYQFYVNDVYPVESKDRTGYAPANDFDVYDLHPELYISLQEQNEELFNDSVTLENEAIRMILSEDPSIKPTPSPKSIQNIISVLEEKYKFAEYAMYVKNFPKYLNIDIQQYFEEIYGPNSGITPENYYEKIDITKQVVLTPTEFNGLSEEACNRYIETLLGL